MGICWKEIRVGLGALPRRPNTLREYRPLFVERSIGYSIDIEHQEARLANSEKTVPVILRVTSILRREEGGEWKLVHRHADPITSVQGVESVIKAKSD